MSLAAADIRPIVSEPSRQTPAIEVRNLHFHYATATESGGQIHDVSFSIEPGQRVALIGPNGAGKSTLLLHLNGLLPETFRGEPSVFVAGRAVTPRTLAEVRRQVGFLFQDPDDQLFCPTVFDDVAFGPRQLGWSTERVETAVRGALAQVRLTGLEKRPPHLLSGGEKRRVCLAGLLACEAQILVLDEPTTSLDPRSRRELISILSTLSATKIIATHDLDMALDLCDRAIVMDKGRLVADGAVREILSDEPLMLAHGLEVPAGLRR